MFRVKFIQDIDGFIDDSDNSSSIIKIYMDTYYWDSNDNLSLAERKMLTYDEQTSFSGEYTFTTSSFNLPNNVLLFPYIRFDLECDGGSSENEADCNMDISLDRVVFQRYGYFY